MLQQNSLCFPCLEKVRTKFPVFPGPWPPCSLLPLLCFISPCCPFCESLFSLLVWKLLEDLRRPDISKNSRNLDIITTWLSSSAANEGFDRLSPLVGGCGCDFSCSISASDSIALALFQHLIRFAMAQLTPCHSRWNPHLGSIHFLPHHL